MVGVPRQEWWTVIVIIIVLVVCEVKRTHTMPELKICFCSNLMKGTRQLRVAGSLFICGAPRRRVECFNIRRDFCEADEYFGICEEFCFCKNGRNGE